MCHIGGVWVWPAQGDSGRAQGDSGKGRQGGRDVHVYPSLGELGFDTASMLFVLHQSFRAEARASTDMHTARGGICPGAAVKWFMGVGVGVGVRVFVCMCMRGHSICHCMPVGADSVCGC